MFDPDTYKRLEERVTKAIKEDEDLLSVLREEIRPLRTAMHRIYPRSRNPWDGRVREKGGS
ncbi:MAG: hypothetical protein GX492_11705 [Firmicutes bacterium]|nr:hypothetical protein [Bacillota bacterium]